MELHRYWVHYQSHHGDRIKYITLVYATCENTAFVLGLRFFRKRFNQYRYVDYVSVGWGAWNIEPKEDGCFCDIVNRLNPGEFLYPTIECVFKVK